MKMLFDFLTLALFFAGYRLYGMYVAVSVAIGLYSAQMIVMWALRKPIEKIQWIVFFLVLVLGGATLLLHNEQIFKWKPTAVYWLFAVTFIGSHFIGKKLAIEHLLGNSFTLPHILWRRLNISWTIFFILVGGLNLFVAYYFDTNTWVNFKFFGVLGLSFAFIIAQAFYLARHTKGRAGDG